MQEFLVLEVSHTISVCVGVEGGCWLCVCVRVRVRVRACLLLALMPVTMLTSVSLDCRSLPP